MLLKYLAYLKVKDLTLTAFCLLPLPRHYRIYRYALTNIVRFYQFLVINQQKYQLRMFVKEYSCTNHR